VLSHLGRVDSEDRSVCRSLRLSHSLNDLYLLFPFRFERESEGVVEGLAAL